MHFLEEKYIPSLSICKKELFIIITFIIITVSSFSQTIRSTFVKLLQKFGLTGNFNPVYASYTFVSCMRFVSGRLIKRSKSTIYTIYVLYRSRSIQLFNVFGLILLPDISHLSRFGFKVKNGTDCNKFNFSSTNGDVNSCIPDRDHVKNLDGTNAIIQMCYVHPTFIYIYV